MGITIFKISFEEVYRLIYGRKSHFTAPLARRRKTKFPTVYPTIYLPKWYFEHSYPLSGLSILLHGVISLPDATSYDNISYFRSDFIVPYAV